MKKPWYDYRAGGSFEGDFSLFCYAKTTKSGFDGTSLSTSFLQVNSSTRLDLRTASWQLPVLQQTPYSLSKGSRKCPSILSAAYLSADIHHDLLQSLPNWCASSSCSLNFHIFPSFCSASFLSAKALILPQKALSAPDEGNISHILKGPSPLWREKIDKLLIKWLLPITPFKLKLFVLTFQIHTALLQHEK